MPLAWDVGNGNTRPEVSTSTSPQVGPAAYGYGNFSPFGAAAPAQPALPANAFSPQAGQYYQQLQTNEINNELQPYIDSFNKSLSGSRSAIDANLQQALQGMSSRNDAASKVVAGMVPAANQNFQLASSLMNGPAATVGGVAPTQATGPAHAMAAQAAQPMNAAIAADKAATVSALPAVQAAQMASYSSGQGALQQQHMIGLQDLADRQAQFDTNMLDKRIGLQHDQAVRDQAQHDQMIGYQHDIDMAKLKHTLDMQSLTDPNNPDSMANKEKLLGDQVGAQPAAGPYANTGMTQSQVNDIKASPQYQRTVALINQFTNTKQAGGAAMIRAHLQGANPDMLKILAAENPGFFAGKGDGGYSGSADMPGPGAGPNGWQGLDVSGGRSNLLLGPMNVPLAEYDALRSRFR